MRKFIVMKKSFIFLHIAVILGGFTGIFGKLISINAASLVWLRVAISCILLYGILKVTKLFKHYSFREAFRLSASGLLPALFWVFFYASIKYSNVSIGVVCFCLTGFFTALLNPVMNNRRLSVVELLLSTLTLIGGSLIFHFDITYRTGIILGTISSFFGSLYIMTNEKLVRKFDTRMMNYYQMLGATVGIGILLPIYLHFSPVQHLIPTTMDLVYLVMLALFCTVGLYLLVAEALKKIPAFTVNLSFNLEPVYSIVLAVLIFHENRDFNGSFYLGLSLIVISVVLQVFTSSPPKSRR
ncbi:MAG TPA: DMT family transporter [Puia sp.]|nr:DMT family transporter [Puia sp.]